MVVGAPNTGKTMFLRHQMAPSRQNFEYSTTLGFNLAVEEFSLVRDIKCKFQLCADCDNLHIGHWSFVDKVQGSLQRC